MSPSLLDITKIYCALPLVSCYFTVCFEKWVSVCTVCCQCESNISDEHGIMYFLPFVSSYQHTVDTACQNQNLVVRCWSFSNVSVFLSLASFFLLKSLSLTFSQIFKDRFQWNTLISRTSTFNNYLICSLVFFIKVSLCCTCVSSSMFGAMTAVKPWRFTMHIFSPLKCEKVHFSCVFSSDGCEMDTLTGMCVVPTR